MDDSRLKKIGAELKKARARREQLAILIEQSRRSVPNGDPEMIFDQSEEETEE